jgi:hypothetical protein
MQPSNQSLQFKTNQKAISWKYRIGILVELGLYIAIMMNDVLIYDILGYLAFVLLASFLGYWLWINTSLMLVERGVVKLTPEWTEEKILSSARYAQVILGIVAIAVIALGYVR